MDGETWYRHLTRVQQFHHKCCTCLVASIFGLHTRSYTILYTVAALLCYRIYCRTVQCSISYSYVKLYKKVRNQRGTHNFTLFVSVRSKAATLKQGKGCLVYETLNENAIHMRGKNYTWLNDIAGHFTYDGLKMMYSKHQLRPCPESNHRLEQPENDDEYDACFEK